MGLLDIKDDPNYINANEATKRAIFEQYSRDDADYQNANQATRDAILKEFGLSATGSTELTTAPPDLTNVAQQTATSTVAKALIGSPEGPIAPAIQKAGQVALGLGKGIAESNISDIAKIVSSPFESAAKGINMLGRIGPTEAVVPTASNPIVATGTRQPMSFGNMLKSGGAALLAPENVFALPYQMAAYEQEKIRANPTAPEYATTPYAQQYRGEYATQGAAGAANRRNAIAGQQYGGLTQQEQDMLEQDRINRAIRRKAAEKVLGPIAPRGM